MQSVLGIFPSKRASQDLCLRISLQLQDNNFSVTGRFNLQQNSFTLVFTDPERQ